MKTIDESQPLSDEDRAWLVSRNDWEAIARIDGEAAPPAAAPAAITGSQDSVRLSEWLRQNYPDEINRGAESSVDCVIRLLTDGVAGPGSAVEVEPAGDPLSLVPDNDPGVGAATDSPTTELGTNDGPEGPIKETAENEVNYEDCTNDELKAELGRRELSRSGTKAEMVDRLREDDSE